MANQDVQRLLLQIDANATLLRQEVSKARNDIDGFADRAERSANRAGGAISGIGNSATMAATRLAGMAAGLISVSQAAGFLVRANADFQRLSAQLEVATGSTSAAASAMAELQTFAAETPFSLGQVTEAYIKLKNLGLDPSVEAMRSFGNTSAAMGKDIMQFIEAVADAATGEFERLKEFGIKASKEGDKVKFTFQGVTTAVENNAAAITAYLRALGDESGAFAGSMAKQAETIDGKLSNLGDAASRLAVTIGNMGFNSNFMAAIEYLSNTISGMSAMLQTRGWKGLFASQDDILKASSPGGNLELLRQRRDEAARKLEDARAIRVMGRAQPQTAARAQAEYDARNREFVEFARANPGISDPMSRFALNANGRFGAVPAAPSSGGKSAKTTKGKSKASNSFTLASDEYGWAALMNDGASANIELANQALRGVADTLGELQTYDFEINPIGREQLELAEEYVDTLTQGLVDAAIQGRSFGAVLQGIARQILASGLVNLLSGGRLGTSFGTSLGALGSIFGGFRANGGPIMPGRAYVVGERGPEVIVPKSSGYVKPNHALGSAGGGVQQVEVSVAPSPLFITTVAQATEAASSEAIRRRTRPRMPIAAGA